MPLPLRGRELAGKFRFVRRLGKGGMASVWLAINTAVDREVAIKVIRPEVLKNEDLVARFRSEAKAAGRIGHPNVCEILDFGVGPIGPYIVMESLAGKNLAQLIRERGSLPAEEAVDIVVQALEGLEAAHARGIVHRDLKPENVFLHEPVNGPPVVKLMDFGVAKFTDGSAEVTTEHGALLGTPEYMAPEQFKGADQAEVRTDIWAVGAILYRALTGKHPFKGATVAATLLMVSHDDPKPIHDLAPDVPQALVDVVLRCMSKQVEDRYADVAALRRALDEAIEFEEGPTSPTMSPVVDDAPADDEDPPANARADESALERRPTETYRVHTPEPKRRAGLTLAALALFGAAVAYAAWPRSKADPAPTPAAPAPEAPAPKPPEVRPHAELPPPPPDDVVIEDDAAQPRLDLGARTPPVSSDVPPPPAPGAFDEPTKPAQPSRSPSDDLEEPVDLPPGVIDLGGGYVLAERRGRRTNHGDARKFCEALGVTRHLGFSGWKLPFPGLVKRIKQSGKGPRGTYWTSARWRGNVTTFSLPSGDMKKGVGADRRAARTLCVAELSSRS